jgi:hypothetical protein
MTSCRPEFRVVRGFLSRLFAFCSGPTVDRIEAEDFQSIAGSFHARQGTNPKRPPTQGVDLSDIEIINLGLRLRSQLDQHRLFDHLKGTSKFETLRVLALGEQFCGEPIDWSQLETLSDTDYSIANSHLLSKIVRSTDYTRLSKFLLAKIDAHQRSVGFSEIVDCKSLSVAMNSFGLSTELQTLAQLNDAFYALKQIKWPLFGSDLLVFMQALSDATWTLSLKQLEILGPIADTWKLQAIAGQLVILRSVNNFNGESKYFRRHSEAILLQSKLPDYLKEYIRRNLNDGDLLRKSIGLSSNPVETSILFSLQFYSYLERQEFNKLLVLIRDQFERDPASMAFLDWDVFHELAPRNWGQQYLQNILLSVILLSAQIATRFESIEFSYGEGFVTNQLINYVKYLKSHNQGLAQFARSISGMREKARGVVAAFILQKSVIEVYAYAFRDKPVGSKLNIPMADLEVCHARMPPLSRGMTVGVSKSRSRPHA